MCSVELLSRRTLYNYSFELHVWVKRTNKLPFPQAKWLHVDFALPKFFKHMTFVIFIKKIIKVVGKFKYKNMIDHGTKTISKLNKKASLFTSI